jgi:hypothetical protein
LLRLARARLRPGGAILVTVPNGYGWFELESFAWFRTPVGWLLTRSGLAFLVRRLRGLFTGGATHSAFASSLDTSPHVQRFTFVSIQLRLQDAGLEVTDATGSVMFCGPFSDMLFTGVQHVMRLNQWLGRRYPRAAAGFYVAARDPSCRR